MCTSIGDSRPNAKWQTVYSLRARYISIHTHYSQPRNLIKRNYNNNGCNLHSETKQKRNTLQNYDTVWPGTMQICNVYALSWCATNTSPCVYDNSSFCQCRCVYGTTTQIVCSTHSTHVVCVICVMNIIFIFSAGFADGFLPFRSRKLDFDVCLVVRCWLNVIWLNDCWVWVEVYTRTLWPGCATCVHSAIRADTRTQATRQILKLFQGWRFGVHTNTHTEWRWRLLRYTNQTIFRTHGATDWTLFILFICRLLVYACKCKLNTLIGVC